MSNITIKTPLHLLRQTATTWVALRGVADDNSPVTSYPGDGQNFACMLRPVSNNDSIQYQGETARTLYTLTHALVGTDGLAVNIQKDYKVTVESVAYRVVGVTLNSSSADCIGRATLERLE